jgi:hypothetical protein
MGKAEDVCDLPNGCHLFREPNEVGGYRYFSDEIGGGIMVWDTCLVSECTLLTAIVEEKRRAYLEYHINRRLIGANKVWDLLVKEASASENDRSEFLFWFKTSLPFYPQNLMTTDKKQLFAKEFRFNGKLGFSSRICFCNQMIKAHVKGKCSVDQLVREINAKLKLISC